MMEIEMTTRILEPMMTKAKAMDEILIKPRSNSSSVKSLIIIVLNVMLDYLMTRMNSHILLRTRNELRPY